MEVYEVMFIAIPAWFGLVGFLASLVFGFDLLNALKAKNVVKASVPQSDPSGSANESWVASPQTSARKGERELVLH